MNRRTLGRLVAPVALAIGLLAATVAPAGASYVHPGTAFTGSCNWSAVTWYNSNPTTVQFSISTGPSCYAKMWVLCGYYGGSAHWVNSVSQTYGPGNYNTQCNGTEIVLNIAITVSGGPYAWICYNANSPYPWVWFRTDVPCTL